VQALTGFHPSEHLFGVRVLPVSAHLRPDVAEVSALEVTFDFSEEQERVLVRFFLPVVRQSWPRLGVVGRLVLFLER